ncbi:MAG TPA: hypothetical protein VNT26_04680, partial [Candidatus Sulfotelmatobacter sp.]|nr:hypothetical protein [Candidatus Sulfotelmatobacter sp.]
MQSTLPIPKALLYRLAITATAVLLFAVGVVYLTRGTFFAATHVGDLHMRWVEGHYIFRGKNPIDAFERFVAESQGKPAPQISRDNQIETDLGVSEALYPPWAYFTTAPLLWPQNFKVAHRMSLALNLALLTSISIWAYRIGRGENPGPGLLLAASMVGINSTYACLSMGQWTILTLVALIAA